MTVFGWDASHYDGQLTPSILVRAAGEGIVFFTHKIGEGLLDTEGGADDTALAAARTAGIPVIGGYLVPRSNAPVAAQVDHWIALADAGEPWWRSHPGWFWQIDLERWPYDAVPASVGIQAAQLLRARTGRWTILYASRGQYGNQLTSWDGPLWNADYVSSGAYPGDGWAPGWAPYSGKTPTILQYTSSATIAGLTTSDRNAFRGTLDQLLALVAGASPNSSPGGPVALSQDDIVDICSGVVQWATRAGALPAGYRGASTNLISIEAQIRGVEADVAAVKAALAAPAPVAMTADQLATISAQVFAALAGVVPTVEEINAAVDKAVKARLDGATVHTAGS